MDLTLSEELAHIADLSHQVRSLSRFRSSFNRGTDLVGSHMNVSFEVDQAGITSAFLNWVEEFTRQKHYAALERQDFCVFVCGLLLSELIRSAPVRVSSKIHQTKKSTLPTKTLPVAEFWPEGFLLTSYCASILEAILQQDFGTSVTLTPAATEIRTWWSFRENAQEDPATAIGFFDLFLGQEPCWEHPRDPLHRPAFHRELLKHRAQPSLQ